MSEIEVGEYVRTKNKGIKRIDTIFENKTVNKYGYEIGSEWDGKLYSIIKTTDIVKHSKDIIDLIEVGDYVNGHKIVNEIYGEDNNNLYFEIEGGFNKAKYISEEDIKSIVTHEQMSSIEYKV